MELFENVIHVIDEIVGTVLFAGVAFWVWMSAIKALFGKTEANARSRLFNARAHLLEEESKSRPEA